MSGLSSVVYFASFFRSEASVTAHVNAFNVGAYKTWRAANGGQWAPFVWVKN